MRRIAALLLSLSLIIPQTVCVSAEIQPDTGAEEIVQIQEDTDTSSPADSLKAPVFDGNGRVTWSCVWFGRYYQKDTNGDGNFDIRDDKAPIKWRVLYKDDDTALLLADKCLDACTWVRQKGACTWEDSEIRSFLNGYDASQNKGGLDFTEDNYSFLFAAFSEEERAAIRKYRVVNDKSTCPYVDYDPGKDTADKVFLLSYYDVHKPDYYGLDKQEGRKAFTTEYTEYKIHQKYVEAACNYWLRSPAYVKDSYPYVYSMDEYGKVECRISNNFFAVRPVIRLNLTKTDLYQYAGTVASDGSVNETAYVPKIEGEEEVTPTEGIYYCFWYGSYPQKDINNDGVIDDKDKSPVKWRLMTDGQKVGDHTYARLMADEILDCVPYNASGESTTYNSSSINKWLNNSVYNAMFSESEKTYILDLEGISLTLPTEATMTGTFPDLNDENPFHPYLAAGQEDINRVARYTDLAAERRKVLNLTEWDTFGRYWLMDLCGSVVNSDRAMDVSEKGKIMSSGTKNVDVARGVRPVIYIDTYVINSPDFQIAGLVSGSGSAKHEIPYESPEERMEEASENSKGTWEGISPEDTLEPAPLEPTVYEKALAARNAGNGAIDDTVGIVPMKSGRKTFYTVTPSGNDIITIARGNSIRILCEGATGFTSDAKKKVSVSKKGIIKGKKATDDKGVNITFTKDSKEYKIAVRVKDPAAGVVTVSGNCTPKKLSVKATVGDSFDLCYPGIPLNCELLTVSNKKGAVKTVPGNDALLDIGRSDGAFHLSAAADAKGTATLPFKVNGKKFTLKVTVKKPKKKR